MYMHMHITIYGILKIVNPTRVGVADTTMIFSLLLNSRNEKETPENIHFVFLQCMPSPQIPPSHRSTNHLTIQDLQQKEEKKGKKMFFVLVEK